MSAIYDNWERLVAAVSRKERDRQLCYADSIATSVGSLAYTRRFGSIAQTAAVPVMSSQIVGPVSEHSQIPVSVVTWHDGITVVLQRLVRPGTDPFAPPRSYFSHNDEMLVIYDQLALVWAGTKDGKYELNWGARVRIAIAVAKAVANSHASLVRTDGVLSLEKVGPAAPVVVIPTDGYRAPDELVGPSKANDVYSYGVVLIELLLGGKLPVSRARLVRWAVRLFHQVGTLVVFEFVPVKDRDELIQMWKMFLVAMWCVQENPEMCDVLKMMQGVVRTN